MTDHPRLTRYIPGLINGTFTGMLRGSGPTLYGPECDSTRGPYVLASEADAEIDRLRAEVERLTGERDEARKPPHCINCHCEESAKGMVDLSDYLDLHRGLMAVVYESKSHAEAVLFSERALRHAESEHVISEAASSATAPNSFADQNRALVAEVANRRGITLEREALERPLELGRATRNWNYRVLCRRDNDGEPYFAVHEVYYDAEGKPTSWTCDAASPAGENALELAVDAARMAAACGLPVLAAAADNTLHQYPDCGCERCGKKQAGSAPAGAKEAREALERAPAAEES